MPRNSAVSRRPLLLIGWMLLLGLLLAGCKNVQSPEVVKIGLIAPFEGPSRPLGYDTLNAVKLRIDQWNDSDDAPFKIELVALNDDSDPALAAILPDQLAQDPDIRVILGPPQGHTAVAAQRALAQAGIPSILLAPVAGVDGVDILPYAGIGRDYRQAFYPVLGEAHAVWSRPITPPAIWLGDPLTLAEIYSTHPDLILGVGPVMEEEVLQAWAPGIEEQYAWAAPVPQNLPQDFPSAYETMTGKPPGYAASLAYAATDAALHLIADSPSRHPSAAQLNAVPTPPIVIIHR